MGQSKRSRTVFESDNGEGSSRSAGGPSTKRGRKHLFVEEQTQDDSSSENNQLPAQDDPHTVVDLSKPKPNHFLFGPPADSYPDRPFPELYHSASSSLESPLKVQDLQKLVLYILGNEQAPRFIGVRNRNEFDRVVVVMVPGLDRSLFKARIRPERRPVYNSINPILQREMVEALQSPFPLSLDEDRNKTGPDAFLPVKLDRYTLDECVMGMADFFPEMLPVNCPGDRRKRTLYSPVSSMLSVPLKTASRSKAAKGKGPQPPSYAEDWKDEPRPVTDFLATVEELNADGYAVHPGMTRTEDEWRQNDELRTRRKQTAADGWVDAWIPDFYPEIPVWDGDVKQLANGQQVMAIDCEMCCTEGDKSALTRVSVMSWDGILLYDKLVQPPTRVTDYLTRFSGITKEQLDPVTTTLAEVQERLFEMFTPDTILVGHSLNSDLAALKMTHPRVVDTALLYPHSRGPPYKNSLRFLAARFLGRDIQNDVRGHDPQEDALAAVDLVRQKCQRGRAWGTPDASQESIFQRLHGCHQDPEFWTAMVDWGPAGRDAGELADLQMSCADDDQVVESIHTAAGRGRAGLVWGRLRELETLRGWWTHSRHAETEALRRACIKAKFPRADDTPPALSEAELDDIVRRTADRIRRLWIGLPRRTAVILYSGSNDQRELRALSERRRKCTAEWHTRSFSAIESTWTARDEVAHEEAFQQARMGIAFIAVR